MNKKSLKGLIYKDFCLSKKEIIGNMAGTIVIIIMILIIALSFKIGNLKVFLDTLAVDNRDEVLRIGAIGAKYYPLFFILFTSASCMSLLKRELDSKWHKYRLSLPVTPARYALAKTIYVLILQIVSAIVGVCYVTICSVITNNKINADDYINLLLFMCAAATFVVYMVNASLLIKSVDVAMFTALGVTSVLALGSTFAAYATDEGITKIVSSIRFLKDNVWILIIYFIVIHLLNWGISTNLYKRREK